MMRGTRGGPAGAGPEPRAMRAPAPPVPTRRGLNAPAAPQREKVGIDRREVTCPARVCWVTLCLDVNIRGSFRILTTPVDAAECADTSSGPQEVTIVPA